MRRMAFSRVSAIPVSIWLAFAAIAFYSFVALFAPLIAPYGEAAVVGAPYELSSSSHWLGTDSLGRDFLSRLIYATRISLAITLITTALAELLGIGLGFLAAISGRWVDTLLTSFNDMAISVPQIVVALLILSIFGSSLPVLIITIALLDATRIFRVARGVALGIAAMDYIETARLCGDSKFRIMIFEIGPNALPPLAADAGIRFVHVLMMISALSFLGLGIQPPAADWGSMLRENAQLISYGVLTPLIPAAAIAGIAIALNVVADWAVRRSGGGND